LCRCYNGSLESIYAKEFQLPETQSRPTFEGLVLVQDGERRYHFWYPKGWHRYELTGGREGVLCSPQAEDPSTFFSVHVQKLATTVGPDDVDLLREGIEEGLSQLPGLNVELAQNSQGAGRMTFERVYTFTDGAATRKRRIRLIYSGNTLYSLMSQGSSVDEYERWLSMLNYCHLTFRLGLFDPTQVS
jgi:hypothetical protein